MLNNWVDFQVSIMKKLWDLAQENLVNIQVFPCYSRINSKWFDIPFRFQMLDSCFMKEVHIELKASLRCSLAKYLLTLGLYKMGLTLSVGQESWSFYILEENHSSTYSQIRTEVCFQKLKISTFLAYRLRKFAKEEWLAVSSSLEKPL